MIVIVKVALYHCDKYVVHANANLVVVVHFVLMISYNEVYIVLANNSCDISTLQEMIPLLFIDNAVYIHTQST